MTYEEQTKLMIQGLIAELSVEQQVVVKQAYHDIRAIVERHGDFGLLALTWVGAEKQLQHAKLR